MIITNIIGGLGNQMFQYAAGCALSLKTGADLRLDTSGFTRYDLHQGFELKRIFNCEAGIASKSDMRDVLGWQYSSGIRRILLRPNLAAFRRKEFVVEPSFNYWLGIKELTGSCYLYGYWQSEKYFIDVAAYIRNEFTFKLPLDDHNAEVCDHIKQVNAVSLHVRRGDFASNPKVMATHGLCSLEYYNTAIHYVTERVKRPYFMVFSDDIEWVKSNLKIDGPHQYVERNSGLDSYNDMRLMSLCRHHIIANSSFSWWGAWLNPRKDKIIVAPKYWFANKINSQDLIPENWVVL